MYTICICRPMHLGICLCPSPQGRPAMPGDETEGEHTKGGSPPTGRCVPPGRTAHTVHILPRTYSTAILLKDIALLKGRGRGGIAPTTTRPTASTTPYYCPLPTAHSSLLPAGTSWRVPASPTCCTTSRAARHGLTTWSRSGEEPEVDSQRCGEP